MTLPYHLDFETNDFRQTPQIYKVGRGEEGVLMVEPYKSEILPYWRFKTPAIAKKSSLKIYRMFLDYKKLHDFIGMDMARKFLEMGYTRARRYANHPSGQKYIHPIDTAPHAEILPQDKDWETNKKTQSARFFYEQYIKAKNDPQYVRMRAEWVE